MTCVAFNAVREYIVGKTAPVPVKVYDYYEPGGFGPSYCIQKSTVVVP